MHKAENPRIADPRAQAQPDLSERSGQRSVDGTAASDQRLLSSQAGERAGRAHHDPAVTGAGGRANIGCHPAQRQGLAEGVGVPAARV